MTPQQLQAFEQEIGDTFNQGLIRAPIHLYDGAEQQIMQVFQRIDTEQDWVCCTWRNHYQALLKGIPAQVLRERILAGKSMIMNLPEYKFICSSIVGGIPSIATGIALAAQRQGTGEHVWCWCGDMSAETGAWHESYKYAVNHRLPITFVVEDNGLSVMTPTHKIWGRDVPYFAQDADWYEADNLIYYRYQNNKYPHAGAGVRVQF